jgi:NAD(P)-dependent dehydrogenase (short-subunit alcohol dehydrogenase family)
MFTLDGQKVLVVGGSSGIGFATAAIAATLGAVVTVASHREEKVQRAVAAIGRGAEGGIIDTSDDHSVDAFFGECGIWDHVVMSAASTRIGPIGTPLADAYDAMNSKFWGAWRVARAAKIRAGGSLGLVGGYLATRPLPGMALMSGINAALEGITRGLALDLKPTRVNLVAPGMIDTPLWHGMPASERETMLSRIAANLPVGRVGQPEDVAWQLLLFMINPFATGTVVTLDGGASIA